MGYGAEGLTNKAFMIKKANLKPAFMNICKMNINNSLKDTFGEAVGQEVCGTSTDSLKDTYAPDKHHCFQWVDWDFDNVCHNITDVLKTFGGYEKYPKPAGVDNDGNLVQIHFNSKLGDFQAVLYAIAPYVEKGGKMYWKDDLGDRYVTDFDKLRTYSPRELAQKRQKLIHKVSTLKALLKTYGDGVYRLKRRLGTTYARVAEQLQIYGIECGNTFADVSDKDLASAPFLAFAKTLTENDTGRECDSHIIRRDLKMIHVDRQIPTDKPLGDDTYREPMSSLYTLCTKRRRLSGLQAFNPKYAKTATLNSIQLIAYRLGQTVKALKAQPLPLTSKA